MIGILLAGGRGTRLYPLTTVTNKMALPVYNRPMFFYPLKTLLDSNITKVIIVIEKVFGEQIKMLVNQFVSLSKMEISYVSQAQPLGMADAIRQNKKIVKNDSVIVIAGDNYFVGDFKTEIKNFQSGAVSFLRRCYDPGRYGVPVYDKWGKLAKIVEKPKKTVTNWVVTGPHLFDNNVFDFIEKLKPSARNELEITDLNNLYLKDSKLQLVKRTDYWTDMGTFDSLLKAANYIKSQNI